MNVLQLAIRDRESQGRESQARHVAYYASDGMAVTPNPPRVGEVTTISYYLQNSEPHPITVRSIETYVATFGMGTAREKLSELGPLVLPADPDHIEEVHLQWVPDAGGHRCLRTSIYLEGRPAPLLLGRNVEVIEATADASFWRVPFRLGNPTAKPQPLRLALSTVPVEGVQIAVEWLEPDGRRQRLNLSQSYWLQPYEERDARLIVWAATPVAFESISDVQAWLGDQFLDGIRVIVRRPAQVAPSRERMLPQARRLQRHMELQKRMEGAGEALHTVPGERAGW